MGVVDALATPRCAIGEIKGGKIEEGWEIKVDLFSGECPLSSLFPCVSVESKTALLGVWS